MGVFRKKRPFYGLEKRPKNPQKSRAGLGFFPPPGGGPGPPPGGGGKKGVFSTKSMIRRHYKGGNAFPGFADPVRSGCTTTVNRSKAFPVIKLSKTKTKP